MAFLCCLKVHLLLLALVHICFYNLYICRVRTAGVWLVCVARSNVKVPIIEGLADIILIMYLE